MNGAGQKETGENETAARLRSILLPLLLLLMIIILFSLQLFSLLRFRRTNAADDRVNVEMRRQTIGKDAGQLCFVFETCGRKSYCCQL